MKAALIIISYIIFLSISTCNKDASYINPADTTEAPITNENNSNSNNNESNIASSQINANTKITVGEIDGQYTVIVNTSETKSNEENPNSPKENNSNNEDREDNSIASSDTNNTPTSYNNNDEELVNNGNNDEEFTEKNNNSSSNTDFMFFDASSIDDSYLLGKFNPATHDDFTLINTKYANRSGMYMRKDAYQAFLKMYNAAKKDGIHLQIVSAARSFSKQKSIWEAKWSGAKKVEGQDLSKAVPFAADRARKILEYSAMPGASRHHWGTDIDLNNLNNEYFASGQGKKIYDWLNKNAKKYGFYQPYTEQDANRPHGHYEEKWHWSYLPVALPLYEMYQKKINYQKISGFKGSDTAKEIQIIDNYVNGIDSSCK